MKKLDLLIIKSYLGPFLITFFLVLFLLVMQFLWKYMDDMIGKGLELIIVIKLLFYASANLVPMALPLAILLASIMTFGNLGEHYELIALKSSGVSLRRIMAPLVVLSILTSMLAFVFSNNIWPLANLKMKSLLYDVRNKKPAIDLKEKVFYDGIDGYVIRVKRKGIDGKKIYDVSIHNHVEGGGNGKIIHADSGKMEMSKDEKYLVLSLYSGYSHNEEELTSKNRNARPLYRSKFKEQIIRYDLSSFAFSRSDEELFKDNYEMLNVVQLQAGIDTLDRVCAQKMADFNLYVSSKYKPFSEPKTVMVSDTDRISLEALEKRDQLKTLQNAIISTRNKMNYAKNIAVEMESLERRKNFHYIEYQRKFTLSFACLVLFFIGAPLGAIIRKGGMGYPVVISVVFFLIFHILSITGEKLAKEGQWTPVMGMWLASIVLTPLGIFLTAKATTDSRLMDMETYTKMWNKIRHVFRLKNV